MVFLNWQELPWYWHGFDMFWFAAMMVVLVPGLLAFVFGWFAFRSRVTGVYLSIITQALTFALLLAFFRNDMGFGGNNGLTDFKDILGFDIQADGTRAGLFAATAWHWRWASRLRLYRRLAHRQGAGRPSATPRAGRASAATGSSTTSCSSGRSRPCWPASAARSTCRRSGSSIPASSPRQLDRGRDLGRVRRPRHAGGCDRGRLLRQCRQVLAHRQLPGDLALRSGCCSSPTTLFLPKGIAGLLTPAGEAAPRLTLAPDPAHGEGVKG